MNRCRTTAGSVVAAALVAAFVSAHGASAASPSAHPGAGKAQDAAPVHAPATPPQDAVTDPALPANVSRARINECGHQWNNMKRAGTATGTWKDFTRGCYAQR